MKLKNIYSKDIYPEDFSYWKKSGLELYNCIQEENPLQVHVKDFHYDITNFQIYLKILFLWERHLHFKPIVFKVFKIKDFKFFFYSFTIDFFNYWALFNNI